MLDMGFIPDVERICSLLGPNRQSLLFSATMAPPIKKLADRFLKEPRMIEVARQATANVNIAQSIVIAPARGKAAVLSGLLRSDNVSSGIVFCNRKKDVKTLVDTLKRDGFRAGQIHGDMEQRDRLSTLEDFKSDRINILVASDVAARGLDIKGVSHVFNYDVPFHAEDYVHRIGRTGRAGKTGIAVTLATPAEAELVADIEKLIGTPIPRRSGTEGPKAEPAAEVSAKPVREKRERAPKPEKPAPKPESVAAKPEPKLQPEPRPSDNDDATDDGVWNGPVPGFLSVSARD
jgi:superfamily II DNA/RNA helicase